MAKLYDSSGNPSVIISKASTLDNSLSSIIPMSRAKGYEKRNYIINEVVKPTDNELVIPYYVVKDNERYVYSNDLGLGASDYSYGDKQNWVNNYETIKFFNDEHYWADILPERHWNWKAYERQNDDDAPGGCSISTSHDKLIWPIFADYASTPAKYWYPNFINTNNDLSGRAIINNQCVCLGITSKISQNVKIGFEAVISGAGLDDYVDKMNEEYTSAANQVPRVCRLFSVRVKGGVDRTDTCAGSNSRTNCIIKFLSFDPLITPAKMEYKKVNNNVYYIRDDNLYTIKFNSSNGLFYIERVSQMGTRTYYTGNTPKWSLSLENALTWSTKSEADAHLDEARTGEAKPATVNVTGDYQTCLSPVYFYDKFTECSFVPYTTPSGSCVYNAIATFGVPRTGGGVDTSSFFYTGPTANNEYNNSAWTLFDQCPESGRSIFITPDELNGFMTYLSAHPNSPYGTLTGTWYSADYSYTRAGYNFDNTENMFVNMPEVKTLALAYHFKPV